MSTTSTTAQQEPAQAQDVRVPSTKESAQPIAHTTKPAPTVPTRAERKQHLDGILLYAMTAMKRAAEAERRGDAAEVIRLARALAKARSVLEAATR